MKTIIFLAIVFTSTFARAEILLTIKRADGSVYWMERFNKQVDGDAWLAREKARSYWEKSWTAAFSGSENAAPDFSSAQARETERAARLSSLRGLESASNLTNQQMQQILQHLLKKELGQ